MANSNSPAPQPPNAIAQQFTGLPMKFLIGSPLMSALEANQAMGVNQVNYILDIAFETGSDGGPLEPVMIQFTLTQPSDSNGANIGPLKSTIQLPLLVLLPLNSLAITNVDVDFTMEVKTSSTTSSQSQQSHSTKVNESWSVSFDDFFDFSTNGSVTSDSKESSQQSQQYSSSDTATYSVKVQAGQLPLPTGVTTIIQSFAKSIGPVPATPISGPPAKT